MAEPLKFLCSFFLSILCFLVCWVLDLILQHAAQILITHFRKANRQIENNLYNISGILGQNCRKQLSFYLMFSVSSTFSHAFFDLYCIVAECKTEKIHIVPAF